jgi:hypothetical protein
MSRALRVPERAARNWAPALKVCLPQRARSPIPWVAQRFGVPLVTHAALALLWGVTLANDPKPEDPGADAELLEFLGSVDSGADSQASADDGSWIEYLSQTDIGKVAKTTTPPKDASKQNATERDAPAPGDKKND